MASEEKTEQATPRRRQDAREKGQVAKSVEVNAAAGLLIGAFTLKALSTGLVQQWQELAMSHFQRIATFQLTTASLQQEFLTAAGGFILLVLPILLVLLVAGVAANLLQVGFIFSKQALAFDFSRLNPLQGLARMFSQRAAMELLKSTAKAALIGYLVYGYFRDHSDELVLLAGNDFRQLGLLITNLCMGLVVRIAIVMVVIALADYGYQRWQFEKNLRMSRQELKEEFKRSEGDPLTKSRARQRQRELARSRMMADVATATVVVTNPTHLAVALRYEPQTMAAPVVVAKGQRLIAQRIKEIAREHRIPVVENKPLARALFADVAIGHPVPVELYQAVAEIIAFVYRQTGRIPS